MIDGRFLLNNYSFRPPSYEPYLLIQRNNAEELTELDIRGETFTLTFETEQRYCNGWLDLENSTMLPCPDEKEVDAKYEQCMGCRERTGFNPAFYNTDEISEQQLKRNSSPHSLYFAHFHGDTVKVGISHTKRGLKRLLEQGARTGLIVKEFTNANLARKYEAQAVQMPWAVEAMQTRQKEKYLHLPYDSRDTQQALKAHLAEFVEASGLDVNEPEFIDLDKYYFADNLLDRANLTGVTNASLSGKCIGLIGSHLITQQDSMQFMLDVRKLRGYYFTLSHTEEKNQFEAQQASLF